MHDYANEIIRNGAIALASPVEDALARDACAIIDEFAEEWLLQNGRREAFQEALGAWSANEPNRKLFGGFYTPYFRNGQGQSNKDQKLVWQFNCSFASIMQHRGIIGLATARTIFELIATGVEFCKGTIAGIANMHNELRRDLLPLASETPVVIRIMRYKSDPLLSTNPHVDKTALSSIIWNDDPVTDQCLVFDLTKERVVQNFKRLHLPENTNVPAYMFFGAAVSNRLEKSEVKEMVHAVLPFKNRQYRYSIACFWLLSNFSMKEFSTKVDFRDMEGLARVQ